jgi:MFS transporter, ACS family, glucarate transporter
MRWTRLPLILRLSSQVAIPLRYRILMLIAFTSAITYLDRVCLSAAAPFMMVSLGLSNMQMGYLFAVFSISYGVCEIPAGYLVDRMDQRAMLTRIVACWSLFTGLTGLLRGYGWLLTTRIAFGAAEAGAFPALARAVRNWFGVSERGKATGVMWMAARIGGAVAPPASMFLIIWVGWQLSFMMFGLLGALWCVFFWYLYRDNPSQHSRATAADLAYARANSGPVTGAGGGQWKRIFSSGNLWALFWMYSASSYGFWFLLTWLPTYLVRQLRMPPQRAGFYAALPLAVGSVSCLGGGSLSDWLVRVLENLRWGRRLVGLGGYLLSGAGFAAAALIQEPDAIIISLIVAEIGLDLATPVAWTSCVEIGGTSAGIAAGFMNSSSSISAFVSPIVAAWIFTKFHSFNAMLLSAGAVNLAAAFLWFKIDPGRPLGMRPGPSVLESCGA